MRFFKYTLGWPGLCLLVTLISLFYCNLSYPQASPEAYKTVMKRADSLLAQSKLKQATIAYHQGLVFDDQSVDAYKGLGKISFAKGDWPQFRKWFELALQVAPDDSEAFDYLYNKSEVRNLVVVGDTLRSQGRLEAARRKYKAALALDNGFVGACKGLGKVAYKKGDWKKSHKWFDRALHLNPDDFEARNFFSSSKKYSDVLSEADRLFESADLEAAKEAYEEAIKIFYFSVRALKRLGEIAVKQEKWGDVKDWYGKVLQLQPDEIEAHYGRGIAYRETGVYKAFIPKKRDFGKSRKHFEFVIERDSLFSDVLYQRALLARHSDKWLEAVRWGEAQLQVKPELPHAHVGLLKLYRLLLIHALDEEITQWLQGHPGVWADFAAAERLRMKGDFAKADSMLSVFVEGHAQHLKMPAYFALVQTKVAKNDEASADVYFKFALASIQDDIDAGYMFEISKYIFNDNELDFYATLESPESKKAFFKSFWTHRNPTPAAPTNERVFEHFKRLNEAEKSFWYDEIRTWGDNPDKAGYLSHPKAFYLNHEFNDKGLIYIRHGAPDEIARTAVLTLTNESWMYYSRGDQPKQIFHFAIDHQAGTGNNWQLTPFLTDRTMLRDRLGWDPKMDRLLLAYSDTERDNMEINSLINQLADESRQVVHHALSTDSHTWSKQQVELSMPHYVAHLRGFGNKTLTEVYFGIPLSELNPASKSNGHEVRFEHGGGVYDGNWNRVGRSFEKVALARVDSSRIFRGMYLHKDDFYLAPGRYNFNFYAKDEARTRIGGWNLQEVVPSYQEKFLAVSDPIPAYDIRPASESSSFSKGEYAIVPNPSRQFIATEPVFLYFEIYNLTRNDAGETDYLIESEMTLLKKEKSGLAKVFGFLGGDDKKSISIANERTGTTSTAVEFTSFDVSKLDAGAYTLTIRVEDRLTGESAEKTIDLTLRKAGKH